MDLVFGLEKKEDEEVEEGVDLRTKYRSVSSSEGREDRKKT
jgi:hypothetical protein